MDVTKFDWGNSNDWYKECIGKEVFQDKIYERFFSVEDGDLVVDVGASVGIFTYSILEKNPSHVFCFEPSPEQFPTLNKNTLGGFVTCINKGLSDVDGLKTLKDVYGHNNQPLEVFTMKFETFINKYKIDKIDFLKTDCEGGEYDIFNEENFEFIKNNVKKIAGEWHLGDPILKEKFRKFRDTYLQYFINVEVYSIDGVNIKWDLMSDNFLEHYTEVIIYIYNV